VVVDVVGMTVVFRDRVWKTPSYAGSRLKTDLEEFVAVVETAQPQER
jgi:hypothetical protein